MNGMGEYIEMRMGMGMGWVPDRPDFRDYTAEHHTVAELLKKTKLAKLPKTLSATVDLRAWCSRLKTRLLGSCTANGRRADGIL
jgi:hypothetical protein